MAFVTGVFGLVAAGAVVQRLAGLEPRTNRVLADAERVDVVLTNLLGNAIRHTASGGRIAARLRRDGRTVRLEVQDTGEGIPAQYRERIFERFFQVPGTKRGGVGLGLYISREIVRAHGGEMGLESEEGKGSTFWFTLPAAGPATIPPG